MLSESNRLTGDRSKFTWSRIMIAVLALLAAAVLLAPYDVVISKAMQAGFLPGDLHKIFHLSEIFAHGFGVLLILIGIYVLFPEKRKYIPRVAMLAAFSGLTAQFIKLFIVRQRPGEFVGQWEKATSTWSGLIEPINPLKEIALNTDNTFQSFPSGHTATAVGLAVGLIYVFPRGKYLFTGLAILASMQRIVGNAHWTSDVLAGAAVGLAVSCLIMQDYGLGAYCNRLESGVDSDNAESTGPGTAMKTIKPSPIEN